MARGHPGKCWYRCYAKCSKWARLFLVQMWRNPVATKPFPELNQRLVVSFRFFFVVDWSFIFTVPKCIGNRFTTPHTCDLLSIFIEVNSVNFKLDVTAIPSEIIKFEFIVILFWFLAKLLFSETSSHIFARFFFHPLPVQRAGK